MFSPGQRLGAFEILALVGRGGMGEVYRAKDVRLDRTVAIKVLPREMAEDGERQKRFEREAHAVSAFNHPHICTLYDVGVEQGVHFMVMEYLEGNTLAERLERGRLPLAEALAVASQIADALDKAHRHGIVHRDLKPGNVMLTPSGAKLLDFGLAKEEQGVGAPRGDSKVATKEQDLTEEGTLVGTLRYMAPEQLEGKSVDARADVFAFGALLYEMLTGRPVFDGANQASVIGAILHETPGAVSAIAPLTPPLLDRIVYQCLAKEPDARWQSVGDVRRALEWLDLDAVRVAAPAFRRPALISAALAAALAGLVTWLVVRAPAPQAAPVSRFSLPLPDLRTVTSGRYRSIAISGDGRRLVYLARSDQSGQNTRLYARSLDETESRVLADVEGAHSPFFSPDGESVGFFAGRELKKVRFAGGAVVTLGDAPVDYMSGTCADWSSDGTILFSANGSLRTVSENGGVVERLTYPDLEAQEAGHGWPFFLPGQAAALFTIWASDGSSRIGIISLSDGSVRILPELDGSHQARYLSSGHLVYAQGGSLWAVAFDLAEQRVDGVPRRVVEGVLNHALLFYDHDRVSRSVTGTRSRGTFRNTHFEVSRNGTLIYIPGAVATGATELVWVDRNGDATPITDGRRTLFYPRLAPDGRTIAVTVGMNEERSVWILDSEDGTGYQLTFGADSSVPVWTPDGSRVAYASDRQGVFDLFWKSVDGTDEPELVVRSALSKWAQSFTPDQSNLVFYEARDATSRDILAVSLDTTTGEVKSVVATPANERGARLSPDGHWLVYVSDESGRDEIYVEPFPPTGGKWLVSEGGGYEPLWSTDGREIIYRQDDALLSVPVHTTESFRTAEPVLLFRGRYSIDPAGRANYDIGPDGRLLMVRRPEDAESERRLSVVLNWHEELERLVRAHRE